MYKCKDNKDAEALYKKFLHLCFYVITSYPRNRSTIITASVSIKYTFPITGQLSVKVGLSSQTSKVHLGHLCGKRNSGKTRTTGKKVYNNGQKEKRQKGKTQNGALGSINSTGRKRRQGSI